MIEIVIRVSNVLILYVDVLMIKYLIKKNVFPVYIYILNCILNNFTIG